MQTFLTFLGPVALAVGLTLIGWSFRLSRAGRPRRRVMVLAAAHGAAITRETRPDLLPVDSARDTRPISRPGTGTRPLDTGT